VTLLDDAASVRGPGIESAQRAYDVLFDYLAVSDEPAPSDAIVCFGSRDPLVPVRAAALFAAGVAPVVVTTGGVALDGGRTEAEVFADELVRRGVPSARVIVERDSLHTGDNVVLGMAMLRSRCGIVASVVAVAWPFVARRCRATFRRHDPGLVVRSAPSFDRPGARTPMTPTTARWAVEQFDRLRRYSDDGEIAPVAVPAEVAAAAADLRLALRDGLGIIVAAR